jgi:hypothetical protein
MKTVLTTYVDVQIAGQLVAEAEKLQITKSKYQAAVIEQAMASRAFRARVARAVSTELNRKA